MAILFSSGSMLKMTWPHYCLPSLLSQCHDSGTSFTTMKPLQRYRWKESKQQTTAHQINIAAGSKTKPNVMAEW
jgi:hypothetical protein